MDEAVNAVVGEEGEEGLPHVGQVLGGEDLPTVDELNVQLGGGVEGGGGGRGRRGQ